MKKLLSLVVAIIAFQFTAYSQVKGETSTKQIELRGNFVSQQGVMTDNSCYGFNIGELYVASGDKEEIKVICFDQMQYSGGSQIYCKNILVRGYYETKKIESNGPCSGGSKEIFYVQSYECLD